MIEKRILIIIAILILSLVFVGCNNTQQTELNKLKKEISNLKTEILLQKNLLDENKYLYDKIEVLETQTKELKDKISILKELTALNNYNTDLTDLSTYENLKFEEFKLSYDDQVLVGLEPISICKMYLYAALIGDYETEYELYITNEGGFFWSKEEDLKIPIEDHMSDFTIFEDIYNLKVEINNNEKHSVILWNSKNGYIDENIYTYIYGFNLQKDGDVWKVSFVPMQ